MEESSIDRLWKNWLNWTDFVWGPCAGFYEYDDETSSAIKAGNLTRRPTVNYSSVVWKLKFISGINNWKLAVRLRGWSEKCGLFFSCVVSVNIEPPIAFSRPIV